MEPTVGFIGTGHMGAPMVRNLLAAGYRVRIWDVDPAKRLALAEAGATLATSPESTVEPGGIVLSMVPDDAALEHIVQGNEGLLHHLGPEGVHVSCSTISPAMTQRIADLYRQKGSGSLVAATVSGRPDVAAAAQLSVLYAGPAGAKARVLPLLRAIGHPERLYDLGEQPEAAAGAKLALNHLIAAIILAMADSTALAEHYGVPGAQLIKVIQASPLFQGKVFEYGEMIAQDTYQPALFPVALGAKDLQLMLAAGSDRHLALPTAERFLEALRLATEFGWQHDDWAVVARVIRAQAAEVSTPGTRSGPRYA